MMKTPIKIGQVWESQDPRDGHRRFVIIGYEEPGGKIIVRSEAGRVTKISRWRLKPQAKRGYVLVDDAQVLK